MPRQKLIPKKVEVGGMTLDLENACLKKNGNLIHLTPKETIRIPSDSRSA